MEFNEVLKNRYSCKKFASTSVSDEKIKAILNSGRVAPTAKNLQEYHVYVVKSDNYLKKIDAVTPCRYNAPVVLVVSYDTTNVYTYPGGLHQSGVEDATIVATHLCLSAYNEGIDSCWINNFNPEDLKQSLGLDEKEEIVMLLDLGYADGIKPLDNHFSRKSLEETVTYL